MSNVYQSPATQGYLYEQVAAKIASLIDQGAIRRGERVPSVRRLRSQLGVSISTVIQAYLLLESRGLIEARPQSGFYVKACSTDLPPEPTTSNPSPSVTAVGVKSLVAKCFRVAWSDVVPLGIGTPSPALLPEKPLNRLLAKVARHQGARGISYDFPPGNEELRRQIARRSLNWGGALSPNEILTTSGAMEAVNLCLRAVAGPGDTIAIESPMYYGILQSIESLGMKALELPTHPRDGVDLDALDSALKRHKIKACLFLPNFNNPLGSCMPERNKKRLAALLERRNLPLIEDDIYGDLHYGPARPKTVKSFDKDGWVLLCSSFSKVLAPGYRVGWVAAGRFYGKVEELKFINSLATSSLPQAAIAEFLGSGRYDRHLRGLRRNIATQVQLMSLAISRYFPKETRVTRPAGGLFLWVELPDSVNALDFHRKALQAKIGVAPGPMFSARQRYQNFIRLNCGQPWSDRIDGALKTLGRLAKNYGK